MNIKSIFLIASLVMLFSNSIAQPTFQKTYNSANGYITPYDIEPTFDGGYIMCGADVGGGNAGGAFLIKTDSTGDVQWSKYYGNIGGEGARSVKQTADSGYIMAGYEPVVDENMYVIKTDASGNVVWAKTYGENDEQDAEAVVTTSDGGYLIVGEAVDQYQRLFIVKTDANGDTLWTRTANHPGSFSTAFSAIETTDGAYVITGFFFGSQLYNSYYLMKLNSNGNVIWTKTYDSGNPAHGRKVIQIADNGFVVSGKAVQAGQDNIFLLRTDSAGNMVWANTYGYIGSETAYDVKQTNDGGFILAGETTSFGNGMPDGYLIKLNAAGLVEWSQTYGGTDEDGLRGVIPVNDGGYILNGYTVSLPVSTLNGYFIKTDSAGNAGCNSLPAQTTSGTLNINTIGGPQLAATGCTITTPLVNESPGLSFTTLCTTVGIDDEEKHATALIVEPNPFQNFITIMPDDKNAHIVLYDIAGNKLLEEKMSETSITFNTQILKPGMYVLKVTEGTRTLNRKIVKY